MANVVTYPAPVVAVANIVRIIQDTDSPELVVGWTAKDGTSKTVTLTRQPFNGETVFNIESLLRSLFGDFQDGGVITVNGRQAGTIPSELSGGYTINGANGFVVAMAALKKGEASNNDLLSLGKKFLTERPAAGDGTITVPVYEGYPSGICVRDYSPNVSLELEHPYMIQRERLFEEEGYENHGCLRLYIDCPVGCSWSLSCPQVGDAVPKFSQEEGAGPATVLYWAEIPNVAEDDGYYVETGTSFPIICSFPEYGITVRAETLAVGEPLTISGFIVQGGNIAFAAGGEYQVPFLLYAGMAFIWGEVLGYADDIVPYACESGDTENPHIYDLPSSGESQVYFYAAPCPDAIFTSVSSMFDLDKVFNPGYGLSVSWGAAVFRSARFLFSEWISGSGVEYRFSVAPFGKGFSGVTDFLNAFGAAPVNPFYLDIIPAGLFDNCPAAENFEGVFVNQKLLPIIPASLFDNCRKVTDFDSAFYGCTGLTGETPYTVLETGERVKLWERSDYPEEFAEVTSSGGCFRGCVGLDDYSEIPGAWR